MLIDRRLACGLCVALALAVITIFILPSTQGPYSVVRGPATVFQAARAAPCARASGARAIVPRFRLSNFAFSCHVIHHPCVHTLHATPSRTYHTPPLLI